MNTDDPPERFSPTTRAEPAAYRTADERSAICPPTRRTRDPASDRPPRLSGSTTVVVSDEATMTNVGRSTAAATPRPATDRRHRLPELDFQRLVVLLTIMGPVGGARRHRPGVAWREPRQRRWYAVVDERPLAGQLAPGSRGQSPPRYERLADAVDAGGGRRGSRQIRKDRQAPTEDARSAPSAAKSGRSDAVRPSGSVRAPRARVRSSPFPPSPSWICTW
jgi:hypothetical protein